MSRFSEEKVLNAVSDLFDIVKEKQSEIDQLKAEKAGLEKSLKSSEALSTLRARTLSSFKEKIEDLEAKLLDKTLRGANDHRD